MSYVIENLAPYVVIGLFVLAGLSFLVALWFLRRGRRDPYWRLRRDAARAGWRWLRVSLALFLVAAGTCLLSSLLPSLIVDGQLPWQTLATPAQVGAVATSPAGPLTMTLEQASSPTPARVTAEPLPGATHTTLPVTVTRIPPTARAEVRPSTTPVPQARPSLTATLQATLTPPASSTAAPVFATSVPTSLATTPPVTAAPPTLVMVTPLDSAVRPRPDAALVIMGVSDRVDSDLRVTNPLSTLPDGVRRIYFGIEYMNMVDGMAWERALYRDGELVQGGAYLWAGGEAGTATHFFGTTEGFGAGDYAIRVYFDVQLSAEYEFAVR